MAPILQCLHMLGIIPKAKNFNVSHVHKQNHFVLSGAISKLHTVQITSDSNGKYISTKYIRIFSAFFD